MTSKQTVQNNEVVNPVVTFKNSIEVQNLYSFISDTGLRREAKILVNLLCKAMTPKKKRRGRAKKVAQ